MPGATGRSGPLATAGAGVRLPVPVSPAGAGREVGDGLALPHHLVAALKKAAQSYSKVKADNDLTFSFKLRLRV